MGAESQRAPTPAGATKRRPVYLDDDDDLAYQRSPSSGRKRKPIDLTGDDDGNSASSSKKTKKSPAKQKEVGEKRLRKWRSHAPLAYQEILARAQSQRLFVIDRFSTGTAEDPEQTITIAGTTGNLYTVKINRTPSCNCPFAQKGKQCKHVVYVLHNTLKAPPELQYQIAFLTSELHTIFINAPPLPTQKTASKPGAGDDPIRKPIEDDCPICCLEFSPDSEEIVYCKAACGNNVHKYCFQQWAAQKKGAGTGGLTCPFCRCQWHDEDVVNKINKMAATRSREGYLNVADQLGLSGLRDYSSYHQPWVRIQRREGNLEDEENEPMWY